MTDQITPPIEPQPQYQPPQPFEQPQQPYQQPQYQPPQQPFEQQPYQQPQQPYQQQPYQHQYQQPQEYQQPYQQPYQQAPQEFAPQAGQEFAPAPAPTKKKSKAPFIIIGVVVFLVALVVVALATKGFGQLDNILSLSNNAQDPIVGTWEVVAFEMAGITIELSDFPAALEAVQTGQGETKLVFFEDFTGMVYNSAISGDITWTSDGHGVYTMYNASEMPMTVEVQNGRLYLDLDFAGVAMVMIFEKSDVTFVHYD